MPAALAYLALPTLGLLLLIVRQHLAETVVADAERRPSTVAAPDDEKLVARAIACIGIAMLVLGIVLFGRFLLVNCLPS